MSATQSQDYYLVEQVHTDGEIPVSLYENKVTGLKVVTAYVECPIVKGDLVFATEAFDDDGLPHTLEHLVFMGSEDYPYKGVLDLLANRCLSSGTNAYTDTDHTNYTLSTAGSDGFLNLLPIYLDHLLFPTLTDSAYTTEVHHINGEGENAGVVYCEMQARENSGDSRCHLEMLRSMYPGKCGYKSETGGLMENLRNSTNNTKVRNYHGAFYHSKNLCVVVTGPVKAEEVFVSIKPIEDKIVEKGLHKMNFDRPWQAPVEPLAESVRRRIQYSSDTDDDGLVYIGFRGPNVVKNFEDLIGLTIILDYLNSTAISPIQRDFVECDEPYCSSVSHSVIENSISCFYLAFESVGKQYLDAVADKLLNLLRNIQEEKEKLDMKRLQSVISRKKVRILSCAETSPHEIIVGPVIGHFLYGSGALKERAQEIPILDKFAKCEAKFWCDMIAKYMTGPESRYVCVVGEPSPSLMKSMAEAEKARIAEQKENLKDKLPEIAAKLKKSIEDNEKPAPKAMLSSIPVPSVDNIKFHSIERVVLKPELNVPFRLQYDSIKTNFITIHVVINTSKILTKNDRLYLPLLSEIILECPIERDGKLVPYETIVAELFSDTISNSAGIGLSSSGNYSVGQISMIFGLSMQVEIEKYERAVKWVHELLYKTVLTRERIKSVATRLVSDISQYKRSGSKVASSAMSGLIYQSNSNQWATNFMRQQKFLKKLLKDLKEKPDAIEKNITRIRDLLTTPNNLLVHIALNKDKFDVSKLHQPWLEVIPKDIIESSPKEYIKLDEIVPCHQLVEPIPNPKGAIVGVGSAESNYMHQHTKSIYSLDHPDLAAIYVLLQYLTQLEGPLWRQIRGLGLSYHYAIDLSVSEGLISFLLYKSSQLVAAYDKAVEIVNRFLKGEEEFEDNLFESAKSSLIFEFIKREKSAAGKSMQSLVAYLRNLDIGYNKELIKKVSCVTKDDLRRVGPVHLQPLFEDPERRSVVCCHPSKQDEITKGLGALGCKLEPLSLEKDSFWNRIE
jgi:Zn-dependent M16 (insulinase) family peptidase